jgi:hypothetical protein
MAPARMDAAGALLCPPPLPRRAAPWRRDLPLRNTWRAARLIVDVYRTCTAYPWTAAKEWAQQMGPMVEKLRADLDGALS